MPTSPQYAFVTLVTSDHYLPGALVVAAALHDVHPSPPIYPDEFDPADFHRVCLVTPETVNVSTVKQLRRAFDAVIGVEVLEADTREELALLGRPDLNTVLTKLHVFRLTDYRKIIFLDADILTLRPISHLFRITASFAAVPDVGWPDVFNSGFFVLEPSEEKFTSVMSLMKSKGSWDGGDQGVLNEWVGRSWERLSFTYNTTPTAVYTYAPAYKRFGSQISNIHFIGPNKPWTQMPFRSTGSSSSSSAPLPPIEGALAPSYDYPALLDRWFSVYDSHYRDPAEDLPTRGDTRLSGSIIEPLARRYESAWDSDARPNVGVEARVEAPSGPPLLGLDELRRLAIEGTGKTEVQGGEGVYQNLPLEGRVDLMRPPKLVVQPVPSALEEEMKSPPQTVRIIVPDSPHTPARQFELMTTLPTPGPHEIPPTPSFRGQSLPPETPTYARPQGTTYDASHRSSLHAFHAIGQSPSPISPTRSPSSHLSPPLLLWNPAVEEPPTDAPLASHFPEDTYFPNLWDKPVPKIPEPEDTGGLFRLQPPPPIPEMLIREGHYKAVIGETPPSYPQPDRSKVKAVFPWEEKPRPAPERYFPRTDSPPPDHSFIQPPPPPLSGLKVIVHPRATRVFPAESVPAQGFPRTTKYDNAWDAVPSIQRYAARLVRPSSMPSPFAAEAEPRSGRSRKSSSATASVEEYRRWQDLVEVSSRDADDEDEDEDEDELSPFTAGADPGQGDGLAVKRSRKTYRMRGTQTPAKVFKHQSVQVPFDDEVASLQPVSRTPVRREQSLPKESKPKASRDHSSSTASVAKQRIQPQPAPERAPVPSPPMPKLSPLTSDSQGALAANTEASSSPSSLFGPTSPEDVSAAYRPPRARRTFDPARGVDVFKRGSEEVLARFLKMESWEEENNSVNTQEGRGPPSTL
ncbi:hypothetical protein BU17DRAFT_50708 [Hysterangium stoloniferum]|nr:hypothetical protein BU17DRAFT_50708 [Hysterangium stoloniferum]